MSHDEKKSREPASERSLELARSIEESSGRRVDTPLRKTFLRSAEEGGLTAPLSLLVSTQGRGSEVPLKLYLALVWRSSSKPFSTEVPARLWAELLSLEDPFGNGARRVNKALIRLEELKLIHLEKRWGETSIVTLLDESGDGTGYQLPSTAYALGRESRDIYFKIPTALWTRGHIQEMNTAAVVMLLLVLSDMRSAEDYIWWSTERFPRLYHISPSMRARGTKELIDRKLLYVKRAPVSDDRGRIFSTQRVRNTYSLINDAKPSFSNEENGVSSSPSS